MLKAIAIIAAAAAAAYAAGFGIGRFESAPPPTPEDADTRPLTERPRGYYVEAGQFVVPVVEGGRTTAFILAQVTVEAPDADRAERLRRDLPHTRNALLQGLYGLAGSGAFAGDTIDPAAASHALRDTLNRDLGAGTALSVLFDRLLRQPNSRA